ncbi:MAG: hypothetical protein VX656_17370 [Candidatus Latescibacterota bacterium]|nr:hypothetical protein [Candidatus Latescibacterota bacterium]
MLKFLLFATICALGYRLVRSLGGSGGKTDDQVVDAEFTEIEESDQETPT